MKLLKDLRRGVEIASSTKNLREFVNNHSVATGQSTLPLSNPVMERGPIILSKPLNWMGALADATITSFDSPYGRGSWASDKIGLTTAVERLQR